VAACTPEPILPEALVGAALQGEGLHSMAGSLPFLAGLTHPILHTSAFFVRKRKERKGKERKGKERKGKERKGKERKGKTFRHQLNEKPSIIAGYPGLSGIHAQLDKMPACMYSPCSSIACQQELT